MLAEPHLQDKEAMGTRRAAKPRASETGRPEPPGRNHLGAPVPGDSTKPSVLPRSEASKDRTLLFPAEIHVCQLKTMTP
jgi:hypothetical protein